MTVPFETGAVTEVAPGVRRLLAPNPSPMTHWGTNTYIVGETELAVIDPGPDDPAHLDTLLAATRGQRVSHIIITHAHLDHSSLAAPLASKTDAPVLAFGAATSGRSDVMQALEAAGHAGGGEGVDHSFVPDEILADGAKVHGAEWALEVIATPGHFAGHLSFAMGDTVFTGDHVMGWASTLISPPDGDVSAFVASCERLRGKDHRTFLPGHGAPIDSPDTRLDWLIAHRRNREEQILNALGPNGQTVAELTERIYVDVPPRLRAAAARNVFAHLVDLTMRNLVSAHPVLAPGAQYFRI